MEERNKKGRKVILTAAMLFVLLGTGWCIYGDHKTSAAASQEGGTEKTAVRIRQGETAEGEIGIFGPGRESCYYKIRLKEDASISLHFEADMKKGKLHVKIMAKDRKIRLKGGQFVLSKSMPETTLTSGMLYAGVYYIKVRPGKKASGKYTIFYQE